MSLARHALRRLPFASPLGRAFSFLASLRRHPATRHVPFVVVSVVFVVSRLFYRAHGVRFDGEPVTYFIQYIPVWAVEHDFWRSLFYLHEQPPLQNLFAGGIYRLFGADPGFRILEAIYAGFAFTIAQCLLACMRRLGVRAWIATISVALFISTPTAVIYQNWLFYHEPVAMLLVLAVYLLLRFYEKGTLRAGVAFFSVLGIAAEFRSVYGPLWMATIAAGLLLWPPFRAGRFSPRKTIVLAAALPIAIVALVNLRTPFQIGQSMGSAIAWSNLPSKIGGVRAAV